MTTLDQLQSLLTQWDIKQSKKRGYNPYALGIYFEAAERAANLIDDGAYVKESLAKCFNDRLLTFLEKGMGVGK